MNKTPICTNEPPKVLGRAAPARRLVQDVVLELGRAVACKIRGAQLGATYPRPQCSEGPKTYESSIVGASSSQENGLNYCSQNGEIMKETI